MGCVAVDDIGIDAGFFSVQYLPFPGLSAVQAIAAGGVARVVGCTYSNNLAMKLQMWG